MDLKAIEKLESRRYTATVPVKNMKRRRAANVINLPRNSRIIASETVQEEFDILQFDSN